MKDEIWKLSVIFTCLIHPRVLGKNCYSSAAGESESCNKRFINQKNSPNATTYSLEKGRDEHFSCLNESSAGQVNCTDEFSDKCLRATLKFSDGLDLVYLGCDDKSESICEKWKTEMNWTVEFGKILDQESSECEHCSEDLCNEKSGITETTAETKKNEENHQGEENITPSYYSNISNIQCYNYRPLDTFNCTTFECIVQFFKDSAKENDCEECSYMTVTYEDNDQLNVAFCDQKGAKKCIRFQHGLTEFSKETLSKAVKSLTCQSCKRKLCNRLGAARSKAVNEFFNASVLIVIAVYFILKQAL